MLIKSFPDKKEFLNQAGHCNVIPVCRQILADTETPVSLLYKIYRDRGPVFLLESVEGGEKWGRYSFLGISAFSQVRVFRDKVTIEEAGSIASLNHAGKPLEILKKYMSRFRPAACPELPRFWGGLVGYLTYEMVSFFEDLPNRLDPQLPLAHFMVPSDLLIFDNVQNSLFCVALGYLENGRSAVQVFQDCHRRLDRIQSLLSARADFKPRSESCTLSLVGRMDSSSFKARVKQVKQYICQGEIIQAVISQPFVSPAPADLLGLYRAQRYVNPSPYMFFFHMDNLVLAGSSPETMVRLENRVATLRPIAGTRPRGKNEQEDRRLADELLSDEKERAEHLMLVDLGRNDLGKVALTGSVQVTDLMVVERYSHVMHLVSNITCDLEEGCDAWNLIEATFPAGTLSGAPKVRAMQIIDEMEQAPRGAYGGAVGYISFSGNLDLAITIRTASVRDGQLMVQAGAGIVADSDPEKELQETINKAGAIQRALALATTPLGNNNDIDD